MLLAMGFFLQEWLFSYLFLDVLWLGMCNNDQTVTDWYIHTDTVAEGEGGRAVHTLKSVIDVICSSQTFGLDLSRCIPFTAAGPPTAWLPSWHSPFLLEATGNESVLPKGKGSCLSFCLPWKLL